MIRIDIAQTSEEIAQTSEETDQEVFERIRDIVTRAGSQEYSPKFFDADPDAGADDVLDSEPKDRVIEPIEVPQAGKE